MPKNFVGPHCSAVLQKFSGSEKFLDKVGGGVSRLSVEKFYSHIAEKFRTATVLCSVSEIFR